ncbi:MAG: flagellar motor switch phosphatase FliY [Lachnospiraceae bacterium]|nr:flagellar motor switch phosphatase FliY [Lachnospiraceae bacterium]MBR4795581.1 flagellar motor switch phosphatase FliY [Lachnospiraceae bacterium]MBR5789459.1 flagellar motor switch phosphatase FliY [Lachnospiraceae bacterium]
MSDGVLSQEEINALLSDTGGDTASFDDDENTLSDEERDAIGEIANISMGTAATTLFSLVNRKVEISTPVVSIATWNDVIENYAKPCVFIRIGYTVGLDGSNILVLKEQDVKVITDLMMGGDGTNTDGELGELHLSAISEAMNQMMGSSATSLSSMLNKMIDISPPTADLIDLQSTSDGSEIDSFLRGKFVRITFKMEIGDLVDSTIMQLYPFSFARDMYNSIAKNMEIDIAGDEAVVNAAEAPKPEAPAPQPAAPQPQPMMNQPMMGQPMMGQPMMGYPDMSMMYQQPPVNVQQAQFQPLMMGDFNPIQQQENIDLIMDVPLEVTVELGRTSKSIKEILEFSPGTIIELNKIAGESIDVLVNGKYVAKGEVVVLEENFGIRITDIIKEQPK